MPQSHPAQDVVPARRSLSRATVALTALVFTLGCRDNDSLPADGSAGSTGIGNAGAGHSDAGSAGTAGSNAGSAGENGVAGSAGSVEDAGSAGTGEVAGSSGTAGSTGAGGAAVSAGSEGTAGNAGSAGTAGFAGVAGSAGSAGIAGAGGSGPLSNCTAGGALFVLGNYADSGGNQVILRAAPKATTFALVPAGAATRTHPPQLFLVNRVCAPGGALIASDGSSNYRLDFIQSGNQLATCLSAAAATLDAALALPPANPSLSASTGCSGQPFTDYSAGSP